MQIWSVEPSSADEENSAIFRIFPNPAENTLHVESDEIISRITIFNLTGNSILDKTDIGDYTTSVNITQLKPGLYIIRIYLGSGEVVSQRFVKK